LSVIFIPATCYVILQSTRVQNYLAQMTAGKLTNLLGTKVEIGLVGFDILNRLFIKNIYLEDCRKDTLLYVKKLTFSIDAINLNKKYLRIEKIELDKAFIHFFIDTSKNINFKYIIDKLAAGKDSTSKGWDVACQNFGLIDSKLTFENQIKSGNDSSVNFTDLRIDQLNIRLRNLKTEKNITSFRMNKLSFIEKSGFILKNFSGRFSICKTFMHLDEMRINTAYSEIVSPKFYFDYARKDDLKNFAQKVNIKFIINQSNIAFADVKFFAPNIRGIDNKIVFSGSIKGKTSDIRCREMKLKVGDALLFDGNISLTGLPKISETFIFLDAKKFVITPSSLETISISGKKLKIPEIIKKVGQITYSGNFAGFMNDFVAYGTFNTSLGTIKSDLSLKPESKTKIAFNGNISAVDFNAGKFFDKEKLIGKVDFNFNANGIIENKSKVTSNFIGILDHFNVLGYTYSRLSVEGSLKDNSFNGSIALVDTNLNLTASGWFDFSKPVPEFDFSANLSKSDLHKLNIIKKDSVFELSFLMNAKFSGNNINNLEGNIDIRNIVLRKFNKDLIVKDLSVHSGKDELSVTSDFMNARITGQRDFGSIKQNIVSTFRFFMPGSFQNTSSTADINSNNFEFNVTLKNTKNVCEFFIPGTYIADNSQFSGRFFPTDSAISFKLNSDFFQTGQNRFIDIVAEANTINDTLSFLFSSNKLYSANQLYCKQLEIQSKAHNDSLLSNISWYNKNSMRSQFASLMYYSKQTDQLKPMLNVHVFPTSFYFLDSLWTLDSTFAYIDSSSLKIGRMTVMQNNQKLYVHGRISENVDDTLNIEFSNFNLANFGMLSKSKHFNLSGNLSGTADIVDFYHQNLLNAIMQIQNFTINNEHLGNTNISISWNSQQQKIKTKIVANKSKYISALLDGEYLPATKELHFTLDVKKVGLNLFEPFVYSTFGLPKGQVTGNLSLTGTSSKPLLNGSLNIDDSRMVVKYLKSGYDFSTKLLIQNNNFMLNNVQLYENKKNIAVLNGILTTSYLKDLMININITANNALILNTGINDNNSYYGKAYASGLVHISGPVKNINIDISQAKTEKNTVLYIPLNKKGSVTQNTFLTFVKKDTYQMKDSLFIPSAYEVNLGGLTLNMDMEITPDAEIQLIFDPKVGDIMKSNGHGNIKIEINNSGNLSMRGDYTVDKGDYLFTMQNLINKKLDLEQGGVLSWNGKPTDAMIDVKAVYHTRASLVPIRPDLKKRIPVDCQLLLKGKLQNPDIAYDILLPNATEETRNIVNDKIVSEGSLSRQFFMLLVTNSFYPSTESQNSSTYENQQALSGTSLGKDIATTTSYELLSNQFSNWISQVSKDFDIGVSYRPGEKNISSQEVEVALSTQILNDRVSINGNFDVVGNEANPNTKTNNLIDVNVDVKLTENGKLRLKAFNRPNDQLFYDQDLYTRGVGLAYREEFNTFGELIRRYYQKLFAPKKKQVKNNP
jgi:hypothetical protein